MIRRIYFSTTNTGKIREAAEIGSIFDWEVVAAPICPEVVEDGDTFQENSRKKARESAIANRSFCVAEDSGIILDGLNGLPGIFSARLSELILDLETLSVVGFCPMDLSRENKDELNNQRVLELLGEKLDRAGRYICQLSLAGPNGEIIADTEGKCEITVEQTPRGNRGFGYDPLVSSEKFPGKTLAELEPFKKNQISHRRQAWEKLFELLTKPELSDYFVPRR